MRQFATYFPATQRQNLPDKTSRFGKTSFPSPLQSVAERLLISFAPLNCCYHIINKLSLCQPIYRTKVYFLKIVQTTHTFSRFIDYQLFTPYILNTITVISLLTAKTRLKRRFFWRRKRDSPYSENGRVYSHSGACNGEFGGVAVSRNQVMIVRENLSVEATKNPTETSGFFGGEREIRTLEPFLTVTRFPVVRPRPTRRFLQKILNFTTLKLYLIYKALSNDIRRNSAKYA